MWLLDAAWSVETLWLLGLVCYVHRREDVQCTFDARARHSHVVPPRVVALALGALVCVAGSANAVFLVSARVLQDAEMRLPFWALRAAAAVSAALRFGLWWRPHGGKDSPVVDASNDTDSQAMDVFHAAAACVAFSSAVVFGGRDAVENLRTLASVTVGILTASKTLVADLRSRGLYGRGLHVGGYAYYLKGAELLVVLAVLNAAAARAMWSLDRTGALAECAATLSGGANGAAAALAFWAAAWPLALRVTHNRSPHRAQTLRPQLPSRARRAIQWARRALERACVAWVDDEVEWLEGLGLGSLQLPLDAPLQWPFGAPPAGLHAYDADADAETRAALRTLLEPIPGCGAAHADIARVVRECLHEPSLVRLHAEDLSTRSKGWHLVRPAGLSDAFPVPPYYDLYDGAKRPVLLQIPLACGLAATLHDTSTGRKAAHIPPVHELPTHQWYYEFNGYHVWWTVPKTSRTDESKAALDRLAANVEWMSRSLPGVFSAYPEYVVYTGPHIGVCEACVYVDSRFADSQDQFRHHDVLSNNVAVLLTFAVRLVVPQTAYMAARFLLVPTMPTHCPGGCRDGSGPCCDRAHARAVVPASTAPLDDLTVLVF